MTSDLLIELLNAIPEDLDAARTLPACWGRPSATARVEQCDPTRANIVAALRTVRTLAEAVLAGQVRPGDEPGALAFALPDDLPDHAAFEFRRTIERLSRPRRRLFRAGPDARHFTLTPSADVPATWPEEWARQAIDELLRIAAGTAGYRLGRCAARQAYGYAPCGRWFVAQPTGRPRQYCSEACQRRGQSRASV